MSHAFSDPYTTPLLPRTEKSRRSSRPLGRISHDFDEDSSGGFVEMRRDLLAGLVSNLEEEEKKLEPLLAAFDLNISRGVDGHPSAATSQTFTAVSTAPSALALSTTNYLDSSHGYGSLSTSGKISADRSQNTYLSTPLRMKYFPTLSPSILKRLLKTPPTRMPTPDRSWTWTEGDSGLSSMPENADQAPLMKTQAVENYGFLSEKLTADAVPACARNYPLGSASSSFGLNTLPLTPPPSSQLPHLDTFPHNNPKSPTSDTRKGNPATEAYDQTRHSAQGVRSPLPSSSADGYTRPAPRSRLRSAKSDLHALSAQKSLMNLNGALRQHAHSALSSGAIQNFRHVMAELRGTGCAESEDESDAGLPPFNPAAPPGIRAPPMTGVTAGDPPATLCSDSCYSGASRRPISCTLLDSPSPCQPDVSMLSLQDEYVDLLLGQADQEEAHAEQLMALAERLQNMAKQRRQLASMAAARGR